MNITPGVLDPEITLSTSILATETAELIDENTYQVLELRTSSGAASLYLVSKFPNVHVDCSDILAELVICVQNNIQFLDLNNIQVFELHGCQILPVDKKYNIIFCSPPASQT